ncbi:Protein translocase subunit SecA [Candidatus Clavichlamydia salmonicola]|nr:Protein translocase subunit SecA [Candidatus Clavichlamydia salmonicola]
MGTEKMFLQFACMLMFGLIKKCFGSSQDRVLRRFRKIVEKVSHWEKTYVFFSEKDLQNKTCELKERYIQGETLDMLLPEAYGLVKQACRLMVGREIAVSGYDQKWDMIPYDVQVLGAIAMHKGYISEMQTGEGKTLTASMPLYLNALSGQSVHLVTVNDYLAQRDSEWVGAVLKLLGLSLGVLTQDIPLANRKEIYQRDVVYGTASEFGFDYLRDNAMATSKDEQVQRGFNFAIIDEIDSVLIDEARTPLIISGPSTKSSQMYDVLKEDVAQLVRSQRELCTSMAEKAKNTIMMFWDLEILPKDKKSLEKLNEATQKLWLISKGMPLNPIVRQARENPDIRVLIDKWDLYYHNDQNKEEKTRILSVLFFVLDEKGNEFELTDKGIQEWSRLQEGSVDDFIMLDLGEAYFHIDEDSSLSLQDKTQKKLEVNEEDIKRKERAHNLHQLLRAHLLMEKDVDYIIEHGKIIIIDEHTGRPQPGRRFSDGLHQAIEAKECLKVQKETQTYATVTLQNYFRLYTKLAGMTGTAITESSEFKEIYKLHVLQIPTYKMCRRIDSNDEFYMTEREKYQAILKEIEDVHRKGRPILVGTESVEISEKLSRILKRSNIPHAVLNAKNHAQEAEIIAQAGAKGAVTVATNMAGRGTDIKLQEGTAVLGGLYVIGTTRNQSRRIDRQLRGRCARLGDPGSAKFFLSFEDQLMRLFASPKMNALIRRFRPPEGAAISDRMLNRLIETAQKRVEGRNYTIRKHTLEYDDVMSHQRKSMYEFRNEILASKNLVEKACDILGQTCVDIVEDSVDKSKSHLGNALFEENFMAIFPLSIEVSSVDFSTPSLLIKKSSQAVIDFFTEKYEATASDLLKVQAEVSVLDVYNDILCSLFVTHIDGLWQAHLEYMDLLRTEVNLRTIGQKDPLVEFKKEGFLLFNLLAKNLRKEISKSLIRLNIGIEGQNNAHQSPSLLSSRGTSFGGTLDYNLHPQ